MNETTQLDCLRRHADPKCPACHGRGVMTLHMPAKDGVRAQQAQTGCNCVKASFARRGNEPSMCLAHKIKLMNTKRCGGCEHLTTEYDDAKKI